SFATAHSLELPMHVYITYITADTSDAKRSKFFSESRSAFLIHEIVKVQFVGPIIITHHFPKIHIIKVLWICFLHFVEHTNKPCNQFLNKLNSGSQPDMALTSETWP